MPSSSPLGKSVIKEWFEKQTDIKSILDVGCGEGTYRKLLGKNYRWLGIEPWRPYYSRFGLGGLYDTLWDKDVRDFEKLPRADCVIFGDILEHLPKKDALVIFEKAKGFKHIVISIPLGKYEQGALEGNPFEIHRSTWTKEEVKALLDWEVVKEFVINPDISEPTLGIFIH